MKESSGIAESPTNAGIFYTHNDSGDRARFFSFDLKGHVRVFRVGNAKSVDWEDMAAAKVDGKAYLFFGDIGDNFGRRESLTVYRVPEPTAAGTLDADQVYTLRYPDEPHNAETLMVHPSSGDLYIVTKAALRPSMVFKLARSLESGSYKLRKVGELTVGGSIRESKLITGGAISPDGHHVVLRTYLSAYEFDAGETFDDWVTATPRIVKTNIDPQGEGIAYLWNGEALVTSSEGRPSQISEIRLQH